MNKSITFGIAGLIGVIAITLLTGNRFDALWAGGSGYLAHQAATANDVEYKRGETISTSEGEILNVKFGDVTIWMDENTEVKLIDGRTESLEINVVQGRVVIIGSITISTREIKTVASGATSLVHYSWLDELEIVSIEGSVTVATPESASFIPAGAAILMGALSPYNFQEVTFDPENSSAAEFYDQTFE